MLYVMEVIVFEAVRTMLVILLAFEEIALKPVCIGSLHSLENASGSVLLLCRGWITNVSQIFSTFRWLNTPHHVPWLNNWLLFFTEGLQSIMSSIPTRQVNITESAFITIISVDPRTLLLHTVVTTAWIIHCNDYYCFVVKWGASMKSDVTNSTSAIAWRAHLSCKSSTHFELIHITVTHAFNSS